MNPSSLSDLPTMTLAASFASWTPIDFETNGTVRDARGFTSMTYSSSSLTANWMFMRPMT